jgi:Heterokaryon incompatibility protein (HET)
MRLLHTSELRLQHFDEDELPQYAILSHTWEDEELSFQQTSSGNFSHCPGFTKVKRSCDTIKDDYEWIWIDTCCINKESSAELTQAISSMYSWYERADECFVYLADFMYVEDSLDDLKHCRWFTRGWTLQELLAPEHIVFWDRCWVPFGTKSQLYKHLSTITGIPNAVLLGTTHPKDCNVGQRMSWVSARKTKRSEDIAYCLLGIFDVNIVPIYGEGPFKAFMRLQEQILKRWTDPSLLVWSPKHDWRNPGLLASTPEAFCKHPDCFEWLDETERMLTPFDPYARMRPLEPGSKEMHASSDGRVVTQYVVLNRSPGESLPTPSLGPRGLFASLLVDERFQDLDTLADRTKSTEMYTICLEIEYEGTYHRSNILLSLYTDVSYGFHSYDISRRGEANLLDY